MARGSRKSWRFSEIRQSQEQNMNKVVSYEVHRAGLKHMIEDAPTWVPVFFSEKMLHEALGALDTTRDPDGDPNLDRALVPFRKYLLSNRKELDEVMKNLLAEVSR